jgi:hypothetical protein
MTREEWAAALLVEQFGHLTPEYRQPRREAPVLEHAADDRPVASVTRLDEWRRTA